MKPEIITEGGIVIIGAGAAGLFAALSLAPRKVIVLSEGPAASAWAQGGLAAAVGQGDSADSHAEDTLKVSGGTADAGVVGALVSEAPRHVDLLEKYGVRFERGEDGSYTLSREAGHARRRVLKAAAGDGFGAELMRALNAAARNTSSITIIEGVSAERLICRDKAVQGVLARRVADGKQIVFPASAVLLATGGAGGLYAATTNPLHATGRGIALAARAGAVLSDLEFMQFHPTAIDTGEDPMPLATEALRGEGARLINSRGAYFIDELAPRDAVSRAIFAQIQGGQKVYLDCRSVDVSRFPGLLKSCARAGLDPQRDLIPVAPAAHYHMGGVATDLNGRTSVQGLWAAGEVASTGLHGANRLASNSVMEAVIMGGRAAEDIARSVPAAPAHIDLAALPDIPALDNMQPEHDRLREIMNDYAGVIRDGAGLTAALRDIAEIAARAEKMDARTADMALTARLVVTSALKREESRGAHYRSDFPESVRGWQRRNFVTLAAMDELSRDNKNEDTRSASPFLPLSPHAPFARGGRGRGEGGGDAGAILQDLR